MRKRFFVMVMMFLVFNSYLPLIGEPIQGVDTCFYGQKSIAETLGSDLPDILSTDMSDAKSFGGSKPSFEAGKINIRSYIPKLHERGSEYHEVWCKMKSVESLANSLEIELSEGNKSCADIQRDLIRNVIGDFDSFNFSVSENSHLTGQSWLNSNVKSSWKSIAEIQIMNQSLTTSTAIENINGLKSFGGVHYCKLISKLGLRVMIKDLAQYNLDRFALPKQQKLAFKIISQGNIEAHSIRWKKNVFSVPTKEATLIYDKSMKDRWLGTIIISPGGRIPPLSMRMLAKSFAMFGYITFIAHYPLDLAILEGRGDENTAISLARSLRKGRVLKGIPSDLQSYYPNVNPLIVFGHSLGGAVLGDLLHAEDNPFDHTIFYGTSLFLNLGNNPLNEGSKISFLFGENERSVNRENSIIENYAQKFDITNETLTGLESADGLRRLQVVPSLNHFCIISDLQVGVKQLRLLDGIGPSPSQCASLLLDFLTKNTLI